MLRVQGSHQENAMETQDNDNATPGHSYLHIHLFLDVMTIRLTVINCVSVLNEEIQLERATTVG